MSAEDTEKAPSNGEAPRKPSPPGSGKGADTALEALIRQRRLGQTPEQLSPPDQAPAQS